MQYTTVEKIKSLFRSIKIEADTGDEAQNTVITTEELEEFIDEVEATMNAKLSTCYKNVYAINVTDNPESFKILRQIASWKTAAIIKNILSLTGKNSKNNNQDLRDDYAMKAKKLMEKICPDNSHCDPCKHKPEIPLPDVEMLDDAPTEFYSIKSSSHKAVIKKDQNNW